MAFHPCFRKCNSPRLEMIYREHVLKSPERNVASHILFASLSLALDNGMGADVPLWEETLTFRSYNPAYSSFSVIQASTNYELPSAPAYVPNDSDSRAHLTLV